MRNFGNDSFATQQHHHHHYLVPSPHHRNSPPSVHQLTVPPSSSRSPTFVKMEPYHLAKSIGVGTNLKQPSKTHFSPVSAIAPTAHHHHQNHHNISGHHNSNSNNCSTNNNNNPNGFPINLSHGQTTLAATTSMISSHPTLENGTHAAATIISHLPTAALSAACPTTTIRGPSPAHHHHQQQSPINGLPYHHHSSHSPTLPVAHTALPSEIHSNSASPMITSNRTSPLSLPPPHVNNAATSNSPYHHVANFNKIHNLNRNTCTGTAADVSQHNQSNCSPASNSLHHGTGSTTSQNVEVTRAHRDDGRKSPNSDRSNSSSVADSNTTTAARIVSQNVNGTYAITGIPSNQAELQVFRVMQRANLLSYFDKMIENGGDDVQQLCEAGNHEFLEIMALIGMAAKPLHVRRLQKALQEWMTQPSLFQSPVLPAGYQHQFGVSHIDRTISHTQFTTTTIAAAPTSSSSATATNGEVGHYPPPSQHHPVPVIPIPHLISHNPISPYPAQNAPLYAQEPPKNSSASTSNDASSKADDPSAQQLNYTTNNNNGKNLKSHERGSNSSSPILASNTTAATIVGLDKVYLQRGSPSIPVVISTAQAYNSGQQGLSSCSSSYTTEHHYQNCPSPSGSTSSNSSTVSIKSHHQFYHPSSPHESSPDSPVNSESGRSISNKHEESNSSNSTCTELENASSSSSSCSSDQTNSIQLWDNSTGTGTLRVASSRSSSYCGSVGGGSEPSSPAPPPPPSFSKGILISSTSQQTSADSPRSSTESVTNRHNNSVAVTSTTSSQDFSSLQEHEIQKLTETAMKIVRSLPPQLKEPKPSKNIEKSSYEFVRRLAEDDPRRMDEIRRLSAIFGKTGENGKRSNKGNSSHSGGLVSPSNKTMSILELAMNEAAAQLCKLIPALLTKRDEMFRLASQVIRESGLPYEVIFANSNLPSSFLSHRSYSSSSSDGVTANGGSKGKINDIRNSPAHEERISHEFAAACKKIKLDMPGIDLKETNGHSSSRKSSNTEGSVRMSEIHNPLRKSPSRENKTSAATSLKKMAPGTAEHRKIAEYRRSQS